MDIIYQSITGYDIFGYIAGQCDFPGGIQYLDPKNCERFSGFFGEEYIAGSFLVSYGLFFLYFYYLNSSKKNPQYDFYNFKSYFNYFVYYNLWRKKCSFKSNFNSFI